MICRTVLLISVAAILLGQVWSLIDLANNFDWYRAVNSDEADFALYLRGVQLLLGLGVMFLCLAKRQNFYHPAPSEVCWASIREGFLVCLLALLVTTAVAWLGWTPEKSIFAKSIDRSILLVFLSIWLARVVLPSRASKPSPSKSAGMEIVLFNIALTVVLLEAALTFIASQSPNPLLWDQSSIESRIQAHRLEPGASFYNTRINSAGYHDQAFFKPDENDMVIGLLADSFGVGIVPYDYNFATIAETGIREHLDRRFDRIAIHNFGIPGIGMDDYAYLLESEVLGYEPDYILVSVFIGNDFIDSKVSARNYFDFRNWIVNISMTATY